MIGDDVKGKARTPKLWNLAFKKLNMSDQVTELNLILNDPQELNTFRETFSTFILGYPNKKVVSTLPTKQKINAELTGYNLVSWNKMTRQFQGYNFDGIAFCRSLTSSFPELIDKSIEIIFWGSGSTAHSFLLEARDNLNVQFSTIISRQPHLVKTLDSKNTLVTDLKNFKATKLSSSFRIFINSSPVGKIGYEVPSFALDFLSRAKIDLVFDFNYGENYKSPFSELVKNSHFLDGNEANVIQAALGFFVTQRGIRFSEQQTIDFFKHLIVQA